MKLLLALLVFAMFTSSASAQISTYSWFKNYPGDGSESPKVATDSRGNIYLAGTYNSTLVNFGASTLPGTAGGNDIFISQYDTSGNLIRLTRFGGSGNDVLNSITTASNGDVIIAGEFGNTITFGSIQLNSVGGSDVFFARIDNAGNVVWAKRAGGSGNDIAKDMSADNNGNLYLCGETTSSTFQINNQTLNIGIYKGLFYGKLDASGNNIWMKFATANPVYSTSQDYSINAIKSNASGNVLLQGILGFQARLTFDSYSSPMITAVSDGSYLANFYGNGNFIHQTLTGTRQRGKSLFIGDDIYLTGWRDFLSLPYHFEAFIALFNSSLTQVAYFGTSSVWGGSPPNYYPNDMASGLVQDYYNNIYAVSYHDSVKGTYSGRSFNLITTGSFLNLINITRDVQINGVKGQGEAIAIDTITNTLYIAGIYNGSSPFNLLNTNLPPTGGTYDMFFIKAQLAAIPTGTLFAVAGNDRSICAGRSTQLGESPAAYGGATPYSYSWAPSTGLSSSSVANPTATPTVNTTYVLTVTDYLGQIAKDTIVVTLIPIPATPTITANTALTFCAGGSVTLTASSSSTYLWSNSATTQTISVNTSGNYTIQVSNASGCVNTSTATIVTVNPKPPVPTVSTNGPSTFCQGGNVTLTSSASNNYLWNNGAATQSITVSIAGSYSVQITNSFGCANTSTATTVTVNPNPSAPTITQSGNILLSSASSGNKWYQNGVLIPGATSQTLVIPQPGDYSVVVTNASGCSTSSASFTAFGVIRAPLSSDTFYYNAFPNPASQNLNVIYTIKNAKNVGVQLLDNFGKVVYTLVNNLQQPAGTYYLTLYNVARFGTGIYYIRYQLDGERVMQKVLIR